MTQVYHNDHNNTRQLPTRVGGGAAVLECDCVQTQPRFIWHNTFVESQTCFKNKIYLKRQVFVYNKLFQRMLLIIIIGIYWKNVVIIKYVIYNMSIMCLTPIDWCSAVKYRFKNQDIVPIFTAFNRLAVQLIYNIFK